MNYTALEDRLFEEWKTRSRQCGDGEEIAPDGLLYRGLFSYADGYWTRRPGDECRRWEQAPRRVLILTKDLNDTEAWDIRCETGRRNFSGPADATVSAPFYKNLMRWVYGLLTVDRHGNTRPFDEADRPDTFRPFYDEAPVARVNCKKQPGGSQLTNSALQAFLTRYADLLEPGFEKAKRELGERAHSDEDVLSYIAFPAQAEAYFEKRDRKEDDNEIHFSIREVK